MADDLFTPDFNAEATIPEVKFEDLVGEGKRYRDPDAVSKALVEKDRFIERLKFEAAQRQEALQAVEDQLKKRNNEQEFLDRLGQMSRQTSPNSGNQPPQDGTNVATAQAVTPEGVEEIIERREAENRQKANLDVSIGKLQELYGDDYKRHVAKQAQAIGMSTADLTDLAKRNPQAFFRVLGIDGTQNQGRGTDAFSPPPRSAVSAMPENQSDVKDYSYFQKLRRDKGEAAYFTPSVQNEMWKALTTLGEEAFYKRR